MKNEHSLTLQIKTQQIFKENLGNSTFQLLNSCQIFKSQMAELNSKTLWTSARETIKDTLPSHISCWFLHWNWRPAVLYHSQKPKLFSVPLGSHIYLGCTLMPGRNSGRKKRSHKNIIRQRKKKKSTNTDFKPDNNFPVLKTHKTHPIFRSHS